jgi:peroxiredoxin
MGTVEVDSLERMLWLNSQVSGQAFTVIVFLRGHWCPFDRAYAQNWDTLHTAIQQNGGKLIGVMTHDLEFCQKALYDWKLTFPVLCDAEAVIATNFEVTMTPTNQSPLKPGYEKANYKYNQAGVFVLDQTSATIFHWRTVPSFANFDGASGRPTPQSVFDYCLFKMSNRQGTAPK